MDNNIVRENVLSEAELTEFKNYLNVEGFEINIREVLQELIMFWASYTDCVNGFIASYQQTEVSE